jgi:Ser/Thr protein kinase RdoA (MazF antagonist)
MAMFFPVTSRLRLPHPNRFVQRFRARQQPAAVDRALAETVIGAYDLRIVGSISRPAGASRSQNLIVETSAGKKLLKRYKSVVNVDMARHEHSILRHLAAVDFPAPRLTANHAGETLVTHDDGHYALYDFLEGYFQYHHYVFAPAQTRSFVAMAGTALGALHDTLRDVTPGGRNLNGFQSRDGQRWHELDWYTEKLDLCRRELTAREAPDFAAHADRIETALRDVDSRLRSAHLPRLIIHGDYGPYNLLFKPGAPVVILDFEIARLDWRLADLAKALGFFALGRMGFNRRHAECFLNGYLSNCPAEPAELQLLPDVWQFLTLRHTIVCWQRHATTRASHWRTEAQRLVKLAHWIDEHKSLLSRLV